MRPSPSLLGRFRNLPLTTKQVAKGWNYKDYNGVGLLGTIDKHGNFRSDLSKIRTFVPPSETWDGAPLKPFVAKKISKFEQIDADTWEAPEEKLSGERYLQMWIEAGGHDPFPEPEMQEQAESPQEAWDPKAQNV